MTSLSTVHSGTSFDYQSARSWIGTAYIGTDRSGITTAGRTHSLIMASDASLRTTHSSTLSFKMDYAIYSEIGGPT